MALKITRAEDELEIGRLVVVLYGPPGLGKTTLGATATKPLLFDFDRGLYRAGLRCDSVQVNEWMDVTRFTAEDLDDYQTIVIDTGGRALDVLSAHLVRRNPKCGKNDGGLTIRGYGELKAKFAAWINYLRSFDKDIVLIVHSEEIQGDGEIKERLEMVRGPKNEVYKVADVMGRLSVVNGERRVTFAPSEAGFGKDPAGLEYADIPKISKSPGYLGELIECVRTELRQRNQAPGAPVAGAEAAS